MKKMIKMMFVLALLLIQIVPQTLVNAAGTNTNDGKIAINKIVEGKTYTIYEILKLESFDETKNAYAYKATEEWNDFVNSATDYLSVDSQGYVAWIDGADIAEFAKLALEYAKENTDKIVTKSEMTATAENIKTKVVDEEEVQYIEFTGLNLGYYLVDSSVGTLCGLTTTDKDAEVNEKNTVPTVTKEVEEDSTGDFGTSNSAQIGQVVNFKTTITIGEGAINYVLHDKMSSGLTFDQTTIVVNKVNNGQKTIVEDTNYTIIPNDTTSITDDCTFEIVFNNEFIKDLSSSDTLEITYSATVNENAVIEEDGNPNTTSLKYGDDTNHTTEPSTTITYVYSFEVIKTNTSHELLPGAKFDLYTKSSANVSGDAKIPVIKIGEENGFNIYRVAKTEAELETAKTTSIEAGKVVIQGLDIDTYYLEETTAPDGYNKLASRVAIIVSGTESDKLTVDSDGNLVLEDNEYVGGGLEVINNNGTLLPSTGGIGTMIFALIGSIMVLGFGVLLVTKLRMSKMSA